MSFIEERTLQAEGAARVKAWHKAAFKTHKLPGTSGSLL
jgi:hypothetical protein